MSRPKRRALLFLVFLGIGLGLGYPSLNRHDAKAPGLADARRYAKMVHFDYEEVPAPFRHRILVPSLAGVLYQAVEPLPLGSWNREMLAMLLVNAALVAAAGLVLLELARALELPGAAQTLLPLVWLSTFGVANIHLVGLIDSAEALFVCLAMLACARRRWRWLPLVLGASALGKETAFLFALVFVAVFLVAERERPTGRRPWLLWLVGVGTGGLVLVLVRLWQGEGPAYPTVDADSSMTSILLGILGAKSLVYTFLVIGPLGLPRLGTLPRPFVVASLAAGAVAVVAAAAASIGDNVARPLFDTIGPMLCLSSAIFLGELLRSRAEG